MNPEIPMPPDAFVTSEDRCSNCRAKLTNAETARLNWQGEANQLRIELQVVKAGREAAVAQEQMIRLECNRLRAELNKANAKIVHLKRARDLLAQVPRGLLRTDQHRELYESIVEYFEPGEEMTMRTALLAAKQAMELYRWDADPDQSDQRYCSYMAVKKAIEEAGSVAPEARGKAEE